MPVASLASVLIFGVAMVKNEADIIEITLRQLVAQGVDHVIVADNMSTDATRSILDRLAGELPLTVLEDLDPAYHQARKMTALAKLAGERGAVWIVPFDADEMWCGQVGTLREALSICASNVAAAPMYEHHPRPTIRRGTVVQRMPWARDVGYAKVAFKWNPEAALLEGNHNVTGVEGEPDWDILDVHHFPLRNFDQWRQKAIEGARAVDLADWPADMALQWRTAARSSNLKLRLRWWRFRLEPKLRFRPVTQARGSVTNER